MSKKLNKGSKKLKKGSKKLKKRSQKAQLRDSAEASRVLVGTKADGLIFSESAGITASSTTLPGRVMDLPGFWWIPGKAMGGVLVGSFLTAAGVRSGEIKPILVGGRRLGSSSPGVGVVGLQITAVSGSRYSARELDKLYTSDVLEDRGSGRNFLRLQLVAVAVTIAFVMLLAVANKVNW